MLFLEEMKTKLAKMSDAEFNERFDSICDEDEDTSITAYEFLQNAKFSFPNIFNTENKSTEIIQNHLNEQYVIAYRKTKESVDNLHSELSLHMKNLNNALRNFNIHLEVKKFDDLKINGIEHSKFSGFKSPEKEFNSSQNSPNMFKMDRNFGGYNTITSEFISCQNAANDEFTDNSAVA